MSDSRPAAGCRRGLHESVGDCERAVGGDLSVSEAISSTALRGPSGRTGGMKMWRRSSVTPERAALPASVRRRVGVDAAHEGLACARPYASSMVASTAPTGASAPAGTRISRRTPEAGASRSSVALSVSISAMASPSVTVSPGVLQPTADPALGRLGAEVGHPDGCAHGVDLTLGLAWQRPPWPP